MNTNVIDPYAKQRAMTLHGFVEWLFNMVREANKQGLFIHRDDNHHTRVVIIPFENRIKIIMDDVEMGYFEEMNQRGYKCEFHQKNRIGIKKGLTPNESLIKSICNHPLILFYNA